MAGRSVGWAVFFAVLDAVLPVECAAGSFVVFGEDDAIVVGSVVDQSVFFGIGERGRGAGGGGAAAPPV